MKSLKIIILFFPFILFSQQKDEWSETMSNAMTDIKKQDFKSAIRNLDKNLKIVPNNPSALYFKGYSQIIIGETDKGCKTLTEALFYNSNSARNVFAEKCMNYDPKLNPEIFKSGKFELQVVGDTFTYNMERKNNIQFESFEGRIYSGNIFWLKNGDYTIIPTEDTLKIISENPKFFTRILLIKDNEYLYEKIEDNQVQFGRIKKIE